MSCSKRALRYNKCSKTAVFLDHEKITKPLKPLQIGDFDKHIKKNEVCHLDHKNAIAPFGAIAFLMLFIHYQPLVLFRDILFLLP